MIKSLFFPAFSAPLMNYLVNGVIPFLFLLKYSKTQSHSKFSDEMTKLKSPIKKQSPKRKNMALVS